MANINLISPTTFTTAVLIGDATTAPNGSDDVIPSMTKVANVTVSAALELQSTKGAFLLPRMSTTQLAALTTPVAGMQAYNTTVGAVQQYTNGGWGGPVGTNIATISLSSAQIAALSVTPVQVLPAPGVGKVYTIQYFYINMTYNSSPYTGGGNVILTYGSNAGSTTGQLTNAANSTVFTSSSNTFAFINGDSPVTVTGTQAYLNTAVYITNLTAPFAGGNSGATLTVYYTILSGIA